MTSFTLVKKRKLDIEPHILELQLADISTIMNEYTLNVTMLVHGQFLHKSREAGIEGWKNA